MVSRPVTVLIADDHEIVRQGIRLLLEAESDLAVVGEASDIAETKAVLGDLAPAVLVLDLHLGRELSLGSLAELRVASPATAVVILTMEGDPAFVQPAWNARASGYVLKEASRADLVRAVRTVGRGGRYLDPAIGALALTNACEAALTNREFEVLRLVALDDLGLGAAIESLAKRQAGIAGLAVELQVAPHRGPRLARDAETAIYRIAQEARSNAVKHSGARRVIVRVDQGAEAVTLTVQDDGQGFDPATAHDGFGLPGMQERAVLAGGRLSLSSKDGGPTCVTAVVPSPAASR